MRDLALHEAGHAIAGLAVGYVIANMHIDPENQWGLTNMAWIDGDGQGDDPICGGIVAWAGAIAEGVDYVAEDGDGEAFVRHRFCNRSITTLRLMCAALMDKYHAAIEALADVLVKRRTLCGATVKRIAFKACPELRKEARRVPRGMVAMLHAYPISEANVPCAHPMRVPAR